MNKIIKVGLIGCGHLGMMHLKNLKAISENEDGIELIGVYDKDTEKSSTEARSFKIDSFNKLDELLGNVNAVVIVTPTVSHFEIAKEAISKGIDCFIEKPVTAKVDEAYTLKNLANQTGTIIQVGHIERFNPAILALGDFVFSPLFIESHRISTFNPRGTDVSVVEDLMIHDIDIILNLVKSGVKSIDASGVAIVSRRIDIANARIRFENGCVANVTASRFSQKKMRKMRIFQKDAYISIDFQENVSEVINLQRKPAGTFSKFGLNKFVIEGEEITVNINKPKTKSVNAMRYELMKFFDCVNKRTVPIVSIKDGIQALEVADEIVKKCSEGAKDYIKEE